jgi:hypothetical protein
MQISWFRKIIFITNLDSYRHIIYTTIIAHIFQTKIQIIIKLGEYSILLETQTKADKLVKLVLKDREN